MKKLTLILAISLFLSQMLPIAAIAQVMDNPFAQQDNIRNQALQDSLLPPIDSSPQNVTQEDSSLHVMSVPQQKSSETQNFYYTVKFKNDISLADVYLCVKGYEFTISANSENRLFKMRIENIEQFSMQYKSYIEDISKSVTRKVDALSDDPRTSQQWALPDIKLPAAWDTTKGDTSIKVAVIDTGFYRGHEDLSNNAVLSGYNICTKTANVSSDEVGHGTMVTSIIAATTNNGLGMAGSCWNVSVVPYKVAKKDPITEEYTIDSADIISAIHMAADSGCDVINMSIGGYEKDPYEQSAVSYAVSKGCIIMASSGNEGETDYQGRLSYPASETGVLSVGAVSNDNQRATFSQYNSELDVVAPGEDILVCGSDSSKSYSIASGTSFSSPYVAGVAALVRSIDKSITEPYFNQLIKTTSSDLGNPSRDDYYGWGLIDAQKMVEAAMYPIIYNVDEGKTYYSLITVYFNEGTATLNGVPYQSGFRIGHGDYTLIVTNKRNNTKTVHFSIDTTKLSVTGVQDGCDYNTDRTITFNIGTATLNGLPFVSGTTVSDEGTHRLRVSGQMQEVDYRFKIDKTFPIVSGVTDGESYDYPVYVSYNEGYATLNGNPFSKNQWVASKGTYTLIVRDSSGNVTSTAFTINNNPIPVTTVKINDKNFTDWVLDEQGNNLFAIDKYNMQLLCIDATSLVLGKTIALGGSPEGIIMDSGKLYIPLGDTKKIAIVDIAGKSIERVLTTTENPAQIVKNGPNLYYLSSGYRCSLYEYNLDTLIEKKIEIGFDFYLPSIAINKELQLLYIGESGLSVAHLYYYSLQQNKIVSTCTGDMGGEVFFTGEGVIWGDTTYDVDNTARMQGNYGSIEFQHVKNGVVFSSGGMFDLKTYQSLGTIYGGEYLVETSTSGGVYIYSDQKISKYQSIDNAISPSNITALLQATPALPVPDNTIARQVIPGRKELGLSSKITKWIIDGQTNTLYAISERDRALFFINLETLDIENTIRFVSSPSDILLDNGKIYIALNNINQIQMIDIASKTIEKKMLLGIKPFKITKVENKLYYLAKEAKALYEYDLLTDSELKKFDIIINNPLLSSDSSTRMLYIGDAITTSNDLYYYDLNQNKLTQKTKGRHFNENSSYNRNKNIFLDNHVLFRGKSFDLNNPDIVIGDYNSKINCLNPIVFVENGIVVTGNEIYDEASFKKLGTLGNYVDLFTVTESGDIFSYNLETMTITRIEGNNIPIDTGNIVARLNATPVPAIPDMISSQLISTGERELDPGFVISQWVVDDDDNLLVLSESEKALFFVDGNRFNIVDRLYFNSAPSDVVVENGKAYLSFTETYKIEVVDIASRAVERTINTLTDPYQLAIDGNNLYYVQLYGLGKVSVINLITGIETTIANQMYSPSLAINKTGHILYVGEKSNLYYFNTIDNKLIKKSDYVYSDLRSVFYDGTYVYFDVSAFDPLDPTIIINNFGLYETIKFAKGGYVFTRNGIYDSETFTCLGSFLTQPDLIEVSSRGDLYIYNKTAQIITRYTGEPIDPLITGVVDGKAYFSEVTITFGIGTATMDGLPFYSGEKVDTLGEHILVVTDYDGYETMIQFKIISHTPDDDILVNIVDNNLKLAILEWGADIDGDNKISRGEMRLLNDVLFLSNYGITNLEGLQYAVNITDLDISGNNIADMTPIASLTALQTLDASYNVIKNLAPLERLTNLNSLYLDSNNITSISSIAKLVNLGTDYGWLSLSQNSITDISPLASLKYLKDITLSENLITDIRPLAGLRDMEYLDLSINEITDISPLATLTFCDPNSIPENSIYKVNDMYGAMLDLSDNPLTDISALSNKAFLQTLYLSRTKINDFTPIANNQDLQELDVSYSGLTTADEFTDFTMLYYLNLDGNSIIDVKQLKNLTNLNGLSLSGNGLRNIDGLQYLVNLYSLNLSDNLLDDISLLQNLEMLSYLDLSNNELGSIKSITSMIVYYLDISNNFIDLSDNSPDMIDINTMIANNEYSYIVYNPQKDVSTDIAPVITVNSYNTAPTNKNVIVTITTDKGKLNATSHTFTQNGSFEFVATDSVGKSTKVIVTITNIDKTAPTIIAKDSNNNSIASNGTATGKVAVLVSGESTKNAKMNNSSVSWPQNGVFINVGQYTINATDSAGNNAIFNFTINPSEILAGSGSAVKINQSAGILTNINPKSTVATLLLSLNAGGGTLKVFDQNGQVITDGNIGTGSKVQLLGSQNQVVDELTVIIYGDINGDGAINALDLLAIKKSLLGQSSLSGAFAEAGNINKDASGVNALDLLAIKKQLLGQSQIVQ